MKNAFVRAMMLWVICAAAIPLWAPAGASAALYHAVDGVMDLGGWHAAKDGPIALDGTWQFYWDALIPPEMLDAGETAAAPLAISVPGTWNDTTVDHRPLSGHGRATYRLRLHLDEPSDDLGLKFLDAATAARIFVDGRPVFTQGHPGDAPIDSRPAFTPGVVRLPPLGHTAEIVIWVSNFHHRLGGLWEPIRIGIFGDLVRERESRSGQRWFLVGAILIIGIYHLGLYVSRHQERAPLYFGLFCLAVAARSLTTGERIIMTIAPAFNWGVLEKIEYISFYLCVPLFGLVLGALFDDAWVRRTTKAVAGIAAALIALVLLTPVRIYSYSMPPFQWLTIGLLVCGLVALGTALKRRSPGALPLLLGFAALAAAGANDILYSRLIIQSIYMLPMGLFIFIMCQALVLANRYADAFHLLDRQHRELETANRNLAEEVEVRKRAERAVKAERDTLDIITRSMGAGLVVISPDYTTLWANSIIKSTYGEVEGQPCHRIFDNLKDVCPDCGVREVFEAGKEMVVHEQTGTDPDGNPYWTEIIATPIYREDGRVAAALEMVVPITDRKQAEMALKESEERFRLIAANLREVVWMGNPDSGRFLYATPAFETIWQRPVRRLLETPQTWFERIHPDDVDRVRASRVRHLLGNATTDEFRLVWPDGTVRHIINRTYPVAGDDGTISVLVGIAEDVTQKRADELEKDALARRLQHARRLETITTLAGGVAHQFNNALNVIINGIELLKIEPLADAADTRSNLARMGRSAERMAALTEQLVAFAQEGHSKHTVVAVSQLLERIIPRVRETVAVPVEVMPGGSDDAKVVVDTAQMEMAVSAILMNAAEAIAPEATGGKVTVATLRVVLEEDGDWRAHQVPAGAYVEIAVSDNGCGMDKDTLERVFDPFFSTKFQGRGLGMAAVFGIVSHHHGWLDVDSDRGRGTAVRILLPVTDEAPQAPPRPPSEDMAARRKGTILLVEDEAMVRDVNRAMLERLGYRVLEAENGETARAMAKRYHQDIAMVLLDIHLPDIDGEALLVVLKNLMPSAKVIICSGDSREELIDKDAHGFLKKPFTLDMLSRTLDAVQAQWPQPPTSR